MPTLFCLEILPVGAHPRIVALVSAQAPLVDAGWSTPFKAAQIAAGWLPARIESAILSLNAAASFAIDTLGGTSVIEISKGPSRRLAIANRPPDWEPRRTLAHVQAMWSIALNMTDGTNTRLAMLLVSGLADEGWEFVQISQHPALLAIVTQDSGWCTQSTSTAGQQLFDVLKLLDDGYVYWVIPTPHIGQGSTIAYGNYFPPTALLRRPQTGRDRGIGCIYVTAAVGATPAAPLSFSNECLVSTSDEVWATDGGPGPRDNYYFDSPSHRNFLSVAWSPSTTGPVAQPAIQSLLGIAPWLPVGAEPSPGIFNNLHLGGFALHEPLWVYGWIGAAESFQVEIESFNWDATNRVLSVTPSRVLIDASRADLSTMFANTAAGTTDPVQLTKINTQITAFNASTIDYLRAITGPAYFTPQARPSLNWRTAVAVASEGGSSGTMQLDATTTLDQFETKLKQAVSTKVLAYARMDSVSTGGPEVTILNVVKQGVNPSASYQFFDQNGAALSRDDANLAIGLGAQQTISAGDFPYATGFADVATLTIALSEQIDLVKLNPPGINESSLMDLAWSADPEVYARQTICQYVQDKRPIGGFICAWQLFSLSANSPVGIPIIR